MFLGSKLNAVQRAKHSCSCALPEAWSLQCCQCSLIVQELVRMNPSSKQKYSLLESKWKVNYDLLRN